VVQLAAVPAPGYTFGSWSGACFGTAAICAVATTQAMAVQATFVSTGELSVTVAGPGDVSSSAEGIECGRSNDQCDATFQSGQLVTLTPAPGPSASFDGWGGPCAQYGTGPCEVQVAESTGVTATFRHASPATGPQTLSVSHGIASMLSAPAILSQCGASDPCSGTVPSGTSVTLEAGGPFVGGDGGLPTVTWSGDCVGNWPVCRVVVDDPTNVAVRQFALLRQSRPVPTASGPLLLVQAVVSGGGRIRGPGVACPLHCNWYLPGGKYVTLTAVPSRGHRFMKWAGFCAGRKRTCRLRVNVDEYAAAVFRR
jgi:hypothetical protein